MGVSTRGGGYLLRGMSAHWGVCLLVSANGGVCPGGVCLGGVCQGVSTKGRWCLPGGMSAQGGSAEEGGVSQYALRQTSPPVDRILYIRL